MDQGTAQRQYKPLLGVVVGIVIGGLIVYFTTRAAPPSAPIVVSTPLPPPTLLPTSTPSPIRVHVAGAVQQSGVYELEPGSIVQEAIEAAGGPTADADLDCINLAQELQDHQQVYVPRQGEENPPPPVSGGSGSSGGLVNINTASAAELETLPRVGPTTAKRIIEYREANGPFETIEEIQEVPNIGPSTFEGLKDLITVGP